MTAKLLSSVFSIPLMISSWTPTPINQLPLPDIKNEKGQWIIQTTGNAGGYAYLLPKEWRDQSPDKLLLEWQWTASVFPDVKSLSPDKKEGDDYSLRIGALFSGSHSMRMPSEFSREINAIHSNVAYVVFYAASNRKEASNKCFKSPYSENILQCFTQVNKKVTPSSQTPYEDLIANFSLNKEETNELKLIGVWIFADSDNSKSSSQASLAALTLRRKN